MGDLRPLTLVEWLESRSQKVGPKTSAGIQYQRAADLIKQFSKTDVDLITNASVALMEYSGGHYHTDCDMLDELAARLRVVLDATELREERG